MTERQTSGGNAGPGAPPEPTRPHRFRLPHWRVFTWFILTFNVLMLVWVISGIAANARTCHGLTGDALTNCEAGNVGVGIGVTLLFVFWALGDVILGVLWLITRPRTRTCPICGNGVKRGLTQCGRCGYDFAQQFRAEPAAITPSASTQASAATEAREPLPGSLPSPVPETLPKRGWYADPSRQHELRFWDGRRWADDVVDHGKRSLAPL